MANKEATIAELKEHFSSSNGIVIKRGKARARGSRGEGRPIVIASCGTSSRRVPCRRSHTLSRLDQFESISAGTTE